jgi:hypothetical protein
MSYPTDESEDVRMAREAVRAAEQEWAATKDSYSTGGWNMEAARRSDVTAAFERFKSAHVKLAELLAAAEKGAGNG